MHVWPFNGRFSHIVASAPPAVRTINRASTRALVSVVYFLPPTNLSVAAADCSVDCRVCGLIYIALVDLPFLVP